MRDGVHHTGHRATCTRTAADEQRVLGVVIFHTHNFLNILHSFPHLFHQAGGQLAVVCIVCSAAFCGDRQACGNGQTEQTHFSQIGTFAAEQILHLGLSFGSFTSKSVNVLCHKFC